MLLVVNLDSENAEWLHEHMDHGDLPNLAALARSGLTIEVNAVALSGIAYPTLYTGQRPADLGFYFPLQWEPSEQRVIECDRIPFPKTLFERVEDAGKRIVVLDPPESRPVRLRNGYCISGVQFRSRVLLSPWSSNRSRSKSLMRHLGPAPRADEIFGPVSVSNLVRLRAALLQAPARLGAAAHACITQDQPDCLWVTCCALHVAGHQFFHLPSVRDSRQRAELEGTRLELARGYDRMIGSLVEILPRGSRVFVTYAKGMGCVTECSDLLPGMVRRILGQKEANQPVSMVRRLIPTSIRRWAAMPMSDRHVLQAMARLSTPRADWARTRAFCLPTDGPGFIRFNVAGRERDGVIGTSGMRELSEEICAGLQTFTDFDGSPCVESVLTPRSLLGDGKCIDRFPDLVVTWKQRPDKSSRGVRSARYGEIRRGSEMIGRSGNHCPGAFAILAGGNQVSSRAGAPMQVEDIPATILDGLCLPVNGVPGHSFWR